MLALARELAEGFAEGAIARDRERRIPRAEIEALTAAGLLAITVPAAFGGAEMPVGTLAELTAILSAADPSIGQIPQNHFFIVEAIRLDGTPEQQAHWFAAVLAGGRFGNAQAEAAAPRQGGIATRIRAEGSGFRIDGIKNYSTGALLADWIGVSALDDAGRRVLALVPRDAPGLEIADDWDGMGQRTTASGTTRLDGVRVRPRDIIPHHRAYERPTRMGALAQIVHAAIEVGIGRAVLADAARLIRGKARAAADSVAARASDDPYVLADFGGMDMAQAGVEALMRRAARLVDAAGPDPERHAAAASIAVAELRAASTEAVLDASSRLFDLVGTRATLAPLSLDRHWRNARTHTLHDPLRSKFQIVGDYWLNGTPPPRHSAI